MQKIASYRRFGAWAILLVFLTGWSLGTMHRLWSHHDHNGPECSANYDGKSSHIHDTRYAKEHCSLCVFVLSAWELVSISTRLTTLASVPDTKDAFQCTPCCTHAIQDTTCLRGPPVL